MKRKIIVIGAGAAGLMAACAAADADADVTVIEHNEKAGKKLFITGKGRCNYSNACETENFFGNVLRNPKFLYSAVYGFDSGSMTSFLNENGCPTKVERGFRCFPESDHAFDVTDTLVRHLKEHGGRIRLRTEADHILTEENLQSKDLRASGVHTKEGRIWRADAVIVATGGRSYPSTGSTGDGYRLAEELGITVLPQQPSLVPLKVEERWPLDLQGLSLKNVAVRLEPFRPADSKTGVSAENKAAGRQKPAGRKYLYEGFGELLFTHFGISGPIVLSASCHTDFSVHPEGFLLHLDLKPALNTEELVARLHREFSVSPARQLRHVLRELMPERLAETVSVLFSEQYGSHGAEGSLRPVRTLNEKEISELASFLKDLRMHVTGTRGFEEAIITKGGISIKEINPSTMESRKIHGLYWAGEVLDVDAYTGGFNLQIAWSTGHLAGLSAAAQ